MLTNVEHVRFEPSTAPATADVRASLMEDPGFGRVFSDHMFLAEWSQAHGWRDPRVVARAELSMHPATAALHYAQIIFEGLKAYRVDRSVAVLFRPEQNARRFAQSAERLAMPPVSEALFVSAVEGLVRADRDWIPEGGNGSLYLRPFAFASEVFLGVKPSATYTFCIIACPVGDYFSGGRSPLSIAVSEHHSRAGPGGTGAAKCAGNYAASLGAQAEATRLGCDQVVFLDACEHRWVEELGGMNIFFVFADGTLLTPPLGDTILPGVTRDSLIALARAEGTVVKEERYSIDQWRADVATGRLQEAFACGTAAVVAPIGELREADARMTIGTGHEGRVTHGLRTRLEEIQRGAGPDPLSWRRRVDLV